MMASTIAFGNDNSGLQAGTINGSVQASFHYATGTVSVHPMHAITQCTQNTIITDPNMRSLSHTTTLYIRNILVLY